MGTKLVRFALDYHRIGIAGASPICFTLKHNNIIPYHEANWYMPNAEWQRPCVSFAMISWFWVLIPMSLNAEMTFMFWTPATCISVCYCLSALATLSG